MKVLRRNPRARAPKHPKTLAERLWALREALGYTQHSLAEQVGVVQATVSAWEKGVSEPSGASWLHLERVLGMSRKALESGRGFKLPDAASAAENLRAESISLPPFSEKSSVLRVSRKGLSSEGLDLAQAERALREAVKAGRPVWLVVG